MREGGGGGEREEGEVEEGEVEEGENPHMCESIGHRPLRGRCPKRGLSNQPTDRQPTDRHSGVKSRVARN